MHNIKDAISNPIVLCSLLAWFVAQFLKVPLYYGVEHKLNWKRIVGSGGMPSSHSAMVIALMMSVGFLDGFDTAAFGICVVLALIVMYDAIGVRRETGTQATVINRILKEVFINGHRISDEELKELIGHTPFEVLGGVVVGCLTTVFYLFVILKL
ncbi:MAG TPA: divergent PAP2 family protein [Candidatus Limiplasma sp.]|nr:divergent PAP2 family protein [Candidatus Limiplasma sp.]